MKLYGNPASPFYARVTIALAFKKLEFELVPTTGAILKEKWFLTLNPMGRIPVMITGDGAVIAESESILNYLENAFPAPSLLPQAPREQVQVRNVIRVTENYVCPVLFRLFPQFSANPRDAALVENEIANLKTGLALLDHFVAPQAYAANGSFSMADCVLFPTLILLGFVEHSFAAPGLIAEQPNIAAYFAAAQANPFLAAARDQIMSGIAKL